MVRTVVARVARVLDEPLMGFLALVALFLALGPTVFDVPADVEVGIEVAEWTIWVAFVVEYLADLFLARDRRAFVTSPWRVLDLLIVVLPLAALALPAGDALRMSPVLRLLRVVRALVFGARVRGRLAVDDEAGAPPPAAPPLRRCHALRQQGGTPEDVTWAALLGGLDGGTDAWFDASGLAAEDFAAVAARLGLPAGLLPTLLADTAYPRVEVFDRASVLFLWLPRVLEDGGLDRRGVVVVVTDRALLTASRAPLDLHGAFADDLEATPVPTAPLATRALLAVLHGALRDYDLVGGQLERRLRGLEGLTEREGGAEFLTQAFRLQQQLSSCKSDLWRLKGILGAVGGGRLTLRAVPPEALEAVRLLEDDASYAHETVFSAREGLLSLVDLRLNVASFEMNRVMRVLAVVSALGLVPAVAGGLLGMNLFDSPYSLSLPQVAFVLGVVMTLLLHVFMVKGWLR